MKTNTLEKNERWPRRGPTTALLPEASRTGKPFNIASCSLLLAMLAHVTGYKQAEFIHTIGDADIYSNHMEQVKRQLSRAPKPLPRLQITRDVATIFDFEFIGYDPDPAIRAPVAV